MPTLDAKIQAIANQSGMSLPPWALVVGLVVILVIAGVMFARRKR